MLLHFLREHIRDEENLLRETLVLLDENSLVLRALLLFLLNAFCILSDVAPQFSSRHIALL